MAETRYCKHCGSPIPPDLPGDFCCAGCAHVHQLIEDRGLDRFYTLRGKTIEPVSPAALRPANFEWLESAASAAEKEGESAHLTLDLKGISCIGCVWMLEELFRRREGGRRFSVNPQTGRADLEWKPGVFSPADFAEEILRFGYRLAPAHQVGHSESGPLLSRLGVCGFLALNTMLFTLPGYLGMDEDFAFAELFDLLALLFATISFGVGGLWFVARAWDAAKMGVLHIDLPIAIGVSAAWAGSIIGWLVDRENLVYFDFVAIFLFLMLAGRWLQERSIEKNRALAQSTDLANLTYSPTSGNERLAASQFKPGLEYSVEPGTTLPVLSRLEKESASFSLENMNGEADAVLFSKGSRIPSGAILTSGQAVQLTALEPWKDSLLQRLTSESAEPARNLLLEKVLAVYTAVVIAIAILGGTAWAVFAEPFSGLQVAISVLVVSCPCSLGIAWPLINDISAVKLRKRGVYLREVSLWARLPRLTDVVFDKTGTLTLENPRLANPEVLESLSPKEKSILLALVETSFHPVGRSLREELIQRGVRPETLAALTETPGAGVAGKTETEEWTLGKSGWKTDAIPDQTNETVFSKDGVAIASFTFTDSIRSGAAAELTYLLNQGFRLAILSGDLQEKVDRLAATLPIPPERALGKLDPGEKAAWIEKNAKSSTLMIGDGANDALAFSKALCRGTPLLDKGLLESRSDFFFTGRDLSGIRVLFETAKRRSRLLRQVFTFAVIYNIAAIALCLAGWMNPLLAAILMPTSALLTLARAAQMRKS
ncbi:MAG: heavy metal translocating P-type ATPase metal-binding domain-containing protein [Verrucomicrobiota bacterium]